VGCDIVEIGSIVSENVMSPTSGSNRLLFFKNFILFIFCIFSILTKTHLFANVLYQSDLFHFEAR